MLLHVLFFYLDNFFILKCKTHCIIIFSSIMIDKKPWNYPFLKTSLVKVSHQIEESAVDDNSSKQNSKSENALGARFKCKVCQRIFPDKSLVVTHSCTGRPAPKIYRCKTCPKEFLYMCKLVQHEKIHVMDKPYKCDVCYCSFSHPCHLGRHMMTHSASANTKCIVCSKVFKNNAQLEKHKLIHNGERIFKCDLCPQTFTDRSLLTAHFNEHTNDQKVSFEEGAKSGRLDNLAKKSTVKSKSNKGRKKNAKINRKMNFRSCKAKSATLKSSRGGKRRNFFKKTTQEDPEITSECQNIERSVTKLGIESRSLKKNALVFQCAICKNEFDKREEFETHLQLHSMKGEQEYVCEICHKFFVNSNVYELHKETYHQEKKMMTNGVNGQYIPRPSLFEKFNISSSSSKANVFTNISSLSETSRLNSTTKQATVLVKSENGLPFVNPKGNSCMNDLPARAKRLLESKFKCLICNENFANSFSLDFHLEKHIIVKTLPRNRHTIWSIHFPQKKFSCKVCRKSFSQRIILRGHSKIMHHGLN